MKIAFVAPLASLSPRSCEYPPVADLLARLPEVGIEVEVLVVVPPGDEPAQLPEALQARSFLLEHTDVETFFRVNTRLERSALLNEEDQRAWDDNCPRSQGLIEYLCERQGALDYIVVWGCIPGPGLTIPGLFPGKVVLFPGIQEEYLFRLPSVARAIRESTAVLVCSQVESRLIQSIVGPTRLPQAVVGFGFEPMENPDEAKTDDSYALFSWTPDPSSNMLLDYFDVYYRQRLTSLKLVVAGCPEGNRTNRAGVEYVMPQNEEQWRRLFRNARLVIDPSGRERFPVPVFRGWQFGRPALLSGRSETSKALCRVSNAGLYFNSAHEFEECLDLLSQGTEKARALGEQGREYLSLACGWDQVLKGYREFLDSLPLTRSMAAQRFAAINVNAMANDAVGNNLVNKLRMLGEMGCEVDGYIENVGTSTPPPEDVRPLIHEVSANEMLSRKGQLQEDFWNRDVFFFDYAVNFSLLRLVPELGAKGKTLLFDFHGVTPPHLWYDSENVDFLEDGVRNVPLLKAGKRVIAHSEFIRSELEGYGIARERIDVIPYAVPIHQFFPTAKNKRLMKWHGLSERDFVMLYVGRMAGNKRIDVLAHALGIACQRHANFKLILLGDFALPPYFRQVENARRIAESYRVSDRLITIEVVHHGELYKYFNLADVYVTSSLHEGFCIPIIEAMACGKPVIGSRSAAIPETIGEAGILFEPENAEELAEHLIRLAEDEQLRDEIGMKGLSRSRQFGIDAFRRNMRQFFLKALNGR